MTATVRFMLGQGGAFAVQLIATVLIAARLGPSGQGEFAIGRTGVVLGDALLWLGLNSGLSYLVARDWRSFLRTLYLASLGHLTVALVLLCLAFVAVLRLTVRGWLPGPVVSAIQEVLPHAALLFVWLMSWCLFQLNYRTLVSLREFDRANVLTLLSGVIILLSISVLRGSLSLSTVIWIHVASLGAAAALGLLWLAKYLKGSNKNNIIGPQLTQAYRVGIKGLVSTVAFLGLYRIDLLFVKTYCGSAQTGLYAVASFIVESVQRISDWLAAILAPQVAAGLEREIQKAWRFAGFGMIAVSCLGLVAGVSVAAGFTPVASLLGSGYQGVEWLILALIPRGLLHAMMVMFAGILSGRGYTLYHPLAGILALAVLVVADWVLVKRYGLFGAAEGIAIGYLVAAAVMYFGSSRTGTKPTKIST